MSHEPVHSDAEQPRVWQLVGVIAVDKEERVQCQCKGCGHGVYARIHMILWPNGRIECWGSECYARELGADAQRRDLQAMFPSLGGRRLTTEEREMLTNNREALIAWFRAEIERAAAEVARRERERRQAAEEREQERQAALAARDPEQQASRQHWNEAQSTADAAAREITERARSRPPQRAEPVRFRAEPMHDPAYLAIRNKLEERWEANGIDVTSVFGRKTLIENALHEYQRSQGQLSGR